MVKTSDNNRIRNIIVGVLIGVFGVAVALLEWLPITFCEDQLYDGLIGKTLQQFCGSIAAILLIRLLRIKLFGKVQNWLYLLPCLLVAINNFQWWSYFNGLQSLVRTDFWGIFLFALYCLCVGVFEECIFRGILFSVVAGYLPYNKKGLIGTFVISSVLFGFAHIFNGNLLQVAYTILTGGLFAFVLIKTKNLLCCGLVHGVYNFCGLLMGKEIDLGLGTGIVLFEWGNVLIMGIVAVLMVAFVFYTLYKYSDEEREDLYKRLAVPQKKKHEDTAERQEDLLENPQENVSEDAQSDENNG